jgi:DNA end-binding protein Ku
MAPRPHWKGYLKLSLVTCPVQMTPATSENEKIRFRTLNRTTDNPVVSEYVDSVTGKKVADADEVKGYEIGENEYVMLEDAELENVALESTKTIEIEKFVPRDAIEWVWLDTPYYLSVEEPVGHEAFSVIRDAMAAEGMVGVSRLVISRRERAVMLEPRGKGIVLWTLRYGDEVRDRSEYFAGIGEVESEPDLERLVDAFIKVETKHWSPTMVADPVQKKLLEMIEIRRRQQVPGRIRTKAPAPSPTSGKVVNIMDALKKSIAEENGKGKRAN